MHVSALFVHAVATDQTIWRRYQQIMEREAEEKRRSANDDRRERGLRSVEARPLVYAKLRPRKLPFITFLPNPRASFLAGPFLPFSKSDPPHSSRDSHIFCIHFLCCHHSRTFFRWVTVTTPALQLLLPPVNFCVCFTCLTNIHCTSDTVHCFPQATGTLRTAALVLPR